MTHTIEVIIKNERSKIKVVPSTEVAQSNTVKASEPEINT
jgi:hypothetical protein